MELGLLRGRSLLLLPPLQEGVHCTIPTMEQWEVWQVWPEEVCLATVSTPFCALMSRPRPRVSAEEEELD